MACTSSLANLSFVIKFLLNFSCAIFFQILDISLSYWSWWYSFTCENNKSLFGMVIKAYATWSCSICAFFILAATMSTIAWVWAYYIGSRSFASSSCSLAIFVLIGRIGRFAISASKTLDIAILLLTNGCVAPGCGYFYNPFRQILLSPFLRPYSSLIVCISANLLESPTI